MIGRQQLWRHPHSILLFPAFGTRSPTLERCRQHRDRDLPDRWSSFDTQTDVVRSSDGQLWRRCGSGRSSWWTLTDSLGRRPDRTRSSLERRLLGSGGRTRPCESDLGLSIRTQAACCCTLAPILRQCYESFIRHEDGRNKNVKKMKRNNINFLESDEKNLNRW